MKKRFSALVAAGVIFAFANTASAHVVVTPFTTLAGAYEQYTLRAPGELPKANFVKLRVELPPKVKFFLVGQTLPGWKYELEKEADKVKAIVWTATNEGVKPGEFALFGFMGNNTMEAGEVPFKAYQTYSDGTVIPWDGSKAEFELPTVEIQPSAGFDHHGKPLKPGETDSDDHDDDEKADPADGTKKEEAALSPEIERKLKQNTIANFLSGAALLVALTSLVLLFRKRS